MVLMHNDTYIYSKILYLTNNLLLCVLLLNCSNTDIQLLFCRHFFLHRNNQYNKYIEHLNTKTNSYNK